MFISPVAILSVLRNSLWKILHDELYLKYLFAYNSTTAYITAIIYAIKVRQKNDTIKNLTPLIEANTY